MRTASTVSTAIRAAAALLLAAAHAGCTTARGADVKNGDILVPASAHGNPSSGPVQPIFFKHSLHAGQYKIPCLYCHAYADRSTVASIPAMSTCMNCHKFVTGSSAENEREISKLLNYNQKGTSIPWLSVYRLPDHAYFNHKRHVRAGLECQSCHGPVQEMDRVYKYSSLQMGWCVTCHKANLSNAKFAASIDCYTCHR